MLLDGNRVSAGCETRYGTIAATRTWSLGAQSLGAKVDGCSGASPQQNWLRTCQINFFRTRLAYRRRLPITAENQIASIWRNQAPYHYSGKLNRPVLRDWSKAEFQR